MELAAENHDADPAIDGLDAFLKEAKLHLKRQAAEDKLREWGAVDMQEVFCDSDLTTELKDHLQLKRCELKRFYDAIGRCKAGHCAMGETRVDSAVAEVACAPEQPGSGTGMAAPGGDRKEPLAEDPSCTWVVRNTFLEPKEDRETIPRTFTAPPSLVRGSPCIEEETNEDEEEEEDEEDEFPKGNSPPSPQQLRYQKTGEMWREYGPESQLVWTQAQIESSAAACSDEPFTGAESGTAMDMLQNPMMYPMWPPCMMAPWTWPPYPPMMPPWFMDPLATPQPSPEEPLPTPQPSLTIENTSTDKVQVVWTARSHFLSSKDSHAKPSPEFQLSLGSATAGPSSPASSSVPCVNFKILIQPKVHSHQKGGASFKKAKGRGYVEIQCMDVLPESAPQVTFSLAVGHARKRGPVTHRFGENTVGRLPSQLAEWDFNSHVEGGTFKVTVDIEPCQKVVIDEATAGTDAEDGAPGLHLVREGQEPSMETAD